MLEEGPSVTTVVCGLVDMGAILLWCLLACAGLGSAIVLEGVLPLSQGRYCDRSEGGVGTCEQRDTCPGSLKAKAESCSYPLVCCPLPGEISSRKCQEYSKIETSSSCPGGSHQQAEPKEFPHMAALGFGSIRDNRWLCGAILISENFLLTVAHCVTRTSTGKIGLPRRVRLGDLRQADEEKDHVQQITVADIIVHPLYTNKNMKYDIALLKLSRDAVFNSFVRPACLYTNSDLFVSSGVAAGWGKTENMAKATDLLKVELPFVSLKFCNESYSKFGSVKGLIDDSVLCAGEKGRDTCKGDTGGPLQIPRSGPGCMAYIVGVTSFGPHECGGGIPGVYSRVSYFVPWIESVVWK